MAAVIFYRTTNDGSVQVGRVEYSNGMLNIQGSESMARTLLEGVDRKNSKAVLSAMKDAPKRFDGAYARAKFVP